MKQDTLGVLRALAHELNSIFDIEIDDVISEEASVIWVMMFSSFCLGRGYTLDEYNAMLEEEFVGINDRTVVVRILFGGYND